MNYHGPEDESLQHNAEDTIDLINDGPNKHPTYNDALLGPQECVGNNLTKLEEDQMDTRVTKFGPLRLFPWDDMENNTRHPLGDSIQPPAE
mmetsp:Transcript_5988/g.9151  ORF Transcript_5988/g.9151 Transcript_5988/m.9151 type:complete len:91 (-) Transcript_5988:379-651(-)